MSLCADEGEGDIKTPKTGEVQLEGGEEESLLISGSQSEGRGPLEGPQCHCKGAWPGVGLDFI